MSINAFDVEDNIISFNQTAKFAALRIFNWTKVHSSYLQQNNLHVSHSTCVIVSLFTLLL